MPKSRCERLCGVEYCWDILSVTSEHGFGHWNRIEVFCYYLRLKLWQTLTHLLCWNRDLRGVVGLDIVKTFSFSSGNAASLGWAAASELSKGTFDTNLNSNPEGRRYCNTARWGTNKYCVNTVKYCEILCEYCEILQRYRREILQDTAQILHKYCEQVVWYCVDIAGNVWNNVLHKRIADQECAWYGLLIFKFNQTPHLQCVNTAFFYYFLHGRIKRFIYI